MKLRVIGSLLAAVFLSSVMLAAPRSIWVSPAGDDANAGTQAAPFRTLEHAVETLEAAGDAEVIVYLADGTHRLTRPLVFGPGGPEIEFLAAPGASPVISGAVQVKGWTLHDQSKNIYRAAAGSSDSRQLYVNGRRATRARTESPGGNNPAGFLPSPVLPPKSSDVTQYVISGGIRFIPTSLNAAGWHDPAKWSNPRDIEAVIETQWKMMRVPLEAITASSATKPGLITLRQPAWTNANLFFSAKPQTCTPDKPGIWSFWQVTRFENAYEFLDQPGEWYLDRAKGTLYYIPRPGEDLATADVELPVLETLVKGIGTPEKPVANIRFEGLTFAYATWLEPSGNEGYVSDQSGFHVTGSTHKPNVIGHVREVTRTPGNLTFTYARNIVFNKNLFLHLGAAALDFGTGSQDGEITGNVFTDISAAAIQLGGVNEIDARPQLAGQATKHNTISDNLIFESGREYVDSAAIFVGFTSRTDVSHNTINDVPWSGIAIGWGWGLLDQGMFPGLPCGQSGMWGNFTTPTANSGNSISFNRITRFLQNRWDGGAIYSTGQQGQSIEDPLVIEGNVANDKADHAGGNTFYTDGGSRYIVLKGNVSYDNRIGRMNLGPLPQCDDPLPYPPLALANVVPYGSDSGGCVTYGDIRYENNYWMEGTIPLEEFALGTLSTILSSILKINPPSDPWSKEGFYDICPYSAAGVSYPTNLTYSNNHDILGVWEVPMAILNGAGARP